MGCRVQIQNKSTLYLDGHLFAQPSTYICDLLMSTRRIRWTKVHFAVQFVQLASFPIIGLHSSQSLPAQYIFTWWHISWIHMEWVDSPQGSVLWPSTVSSLTRGISEKSLQKIFSNPYPYDYGQFCHSLPKYRVTKNTKKKTKTKTKTKTIREQPKSAIFETCDLCSIWETCEHWDTHYISDTWEKQSQHSL